MTAWPASGEYVLPSDSNVGQVTIKPVMPVAVGSVAPAEFVSGLFEIGHASNPVPGSMVPARLFDNGSLNMSKPICPVKSPLPPKASQRWIWKPPKPASLDAGVLVRPPCIGPPASCSPLSGKSSSNTNTESFAGGYGEGSEMTVTGAHVGVPVQVFAGATGLQAAGIGAPPMPWPVVFAP